MTSFLENLEKFIVKFKKLGFSVPLTKISL